MGSDHPIESDPAYDIGTKPPRPFFVRCGLIAALLTTVVLIALLLRGWYKVEFPNAAIVTFGDETTKDVVITVIAAGSGDAGTRTVASGKMVPGDHHMYVVLVREGDYIVRASVNGTTFMEQRVFVPADRGLSIEVTLPPELVLSSTRPTSQPSTRESWRSETNLP